MCKNPSGIWELNTFLEVVEKSMASTEYRIYCGLMSELMTSPKVIAKNRPYFSKLFFLSTQFYFQNHIVVLGKHQSSIGLPIYYWPHVFWPFNTQWTRCMLLLSSHTHHFTLACRWRVSLKIKWITVQELVLSVFNQSLIPDLKDTYHKSLSPFC